VNAALSSQNPLPQIIDLAAQGTDDAQTGDDDATSHSTERSVRLRKWKLQTGKRRTSEPTSIGDFRRRSKELEKVRNSSATLDGDSFA